MKIVRNCYFEGCKTNTEVDFKDNVFKASSYCNECATPLIVSIMIARTEININCPRCLNFNYHKILNKNTKHILKCRTCRFVYRFKEVYN